MWNKIYFDKDEYDKKYLPREWNRRRIAAARRALKKEREKAGLFGEELMRFTSVEERISQVDKNIIERSNTFRNDDARIIWDIRKRFRALPKNIQQEIVDHWNKSMVPKVPFRFSSLIHRYEVDNKFFDRKKGLATKYIKNVLENGVIKIVEVTQEQYWKSIYKIDTVKG